MSIAAESVFQITHWRGLNENPDGDTELSLGEASEMRNFRITEDGSLQLRPGYRVVSTARNWSGAICGVWDGNVNGRDVTVFAADGALWEYKHESGSAVQISAAPVNGEVRFFGFGGKLYTLGGGLYLVWDGVNPAADVTGYRPVVAVSSPPTGGGTELEQANKLTAAKRVWFSPNGTSNTFQMPEKNLKSVDFVKNRMSGADIATSAYTVNLVNGTVTFTSGNIPATGTNSIEIAYTGAADTRTEVTNMRFAEIFNGAGDNRVFLCGDGTNRAIYSGLDNDGSARADYFPAMNFMDVGVQNTPLTAIIRHGSRLMAFKTDSAFAISYGTLTLEDGRVTAAFYHTPVSRTTGCVAPGQAQAVGNCVRTLTDGAVWEWRSSSGSSAVSEISRKIGRTLSALELAFVSTYTDAPRREYYILGGTVAAVNNYATDTWYVYTDFPFTRMFGHGGELYGVTPDGEIAAISSRYHNDNGSELHAVWRSGALSFGQDFRRKYSGRVFVTMKPEPLSRLTVSVRTDKIAAFGEHVITKSLAAFVNVNFQHWSFGTNRQPQVARLKIRAKKFAYYQLVLESRSDWSAATVLAADIRLRRAGEIR